MVYKEIAQMEEISAIIENDEAALIYFSTPTCNVCKVLKPKVAELIQESFPKIKMYYINIEEAPIISGQLRILSIPTLLIYFDKKEFVIKMRNIELSELKAEIERPYGMMFL